MENDMNHLSEEQIAIYAEALATDTSVNLPDDIKRHVKYCVDCTNEIHAVSEVLRENYKNSIAEGLNNIKRKKSIGLGFWFAAASVIIIAALSFIFTKSSNTPENNLMAIDSSLFEANKIANTYDELHDNVVDTSIIVDYNDNGIEEPITKKKEIAIAFNTNNDLEKLVNRFEDASLRGEHISIITPSYIILNKADSINLEWNNTNNQYLTIDIFDNRGNKITSKTSSKNIVTITEISKKGLYYWKLINEDYDLLFCGKIEYNK